jgi:2-dehydro-3-deoxyphosphogluconate aldolase/(4S)-4-hydroxy-2-oxoglutarate aldolase
MNKVLTEIFNIGIVPVVVIDRAQQALSVARALSAGGINCAEITFRTDAAEDSIKIISREMPEMLVGAGTVLTVEQADKARSAGAQFIVSPGLNPKIVRHCLNENITVIPGCMTPSDVEIALGLGLEVVKFFPAEAAGGINTIKAISAPYANIKFVPTGGIDAGKLNSYISFNKVIACGGSWMVTKELLKNENYETITKLSKEAMYTVLGFELHHVGINSQNAIFADEISNRLESLFGFAKRETSNSFFAGRMEVMKKQFLGKNGHAAIITNNTARAVYHLKKLGVTFNEKTASYDGSGNLKSIYVNEEIGNLAVHLVTRS